MSGAAVGPRSPGAPAVDGSPHGIHTKRRIDAPRGFFEVEAAGLTWLAAAGGVAVVAPLSVGPDELVLPRLPEVTPTAAAARQFGRDLAVTHDAGAAAFGSPPDGWHEDGWIGPLRLPLREAPDWASWFAEFRVLPYLRSARDAGAIDAGDAAAVGAALDRLVDPAAGLAGPPQPPARLHGDLWNGNVMWTAEEVVLIDPAAHGGHRETDLAMLALFGLAHLDEVLAGYRAVHPLADGWRERMAVHQLHPLLVHATRFGGRYGARAGSLARAYR